jgi:hypothetical protein
VELFLVLNTQATSGTHNPQQQLKEIDEIDASNKQQTRTNSNGCFMSTLGIEMDMLKYWYVKDPRNEMQSRRARYKISMQAQTFLLVFPLAHGVVFRDSNFTTTRQATVVV